MWYGVQVTAFWGGVCRIYAGLRFVRKTAVFVIGA